MEQHIDVSQSDRYFLKNTERTPIPKQRKTHNPIKKRATGSARQMANQLLQRRSTSRISRTVTSKPQGCDVTRRGRPLENGAKPPQKAARAGEDAEEDTWAAAAVAGDGRAGLQPLHPELPRSSRHPPLVSIGRGDRGRSGTGPAVPVPSGAAAETRVAHRPAGRPMAKGHVACIANGVPLSPGKEGTSTKFEGKEDPYRTSRVTPLV